MDLRVKDQEIPSWIAQAIQEGLFAVDETGEIWNTQNFDTALALRLIQWKQQQERCTNGTQGTTEIIKL